MVVAGIRNWRILKEKCKREYWISIMAIRETKKNIGKEKQDTIHISINPSKLRNLRFEKFVLGCGYQLK